MTGVSSGLGTVPVTPLRCGVKYRATLAAAAVAVVAAAVAALVLVLVLVVVDISVSLFWIVIVE